MSAAFWVCAAITTISALVCLGYSVMALTGSDVSSMYASARSVALAAVAVAALFAHSKSYLEAVASAMVIVQAIDAGIGAVIHDRLKTFGPAVTSVANAAALAWLLLSG